MLWRCDGNWRGYFKRDERDGENPRAILGLE